MYGTSRGPSPFAQALASIPARRCTAPQPAQLLGDKQACLHILGASVGEARHNAQSVVKTGCVLSDSRGAGGFTASASRERLRAE